VLCEWECNKWCMITHLSEWGFHSKHSSPDYYWRNNIVFFWHFKCSIFPTNIACEGPVYDDKTYWVITMIPKNVLIKLW
jgi:hypothetical protein